MWTFSEALKDPEKEKPTQKIAPFLCLLFLSLSFQLISFGEMDRNFMYSKDSFTRILFP